MKTNVLYFEGAGCDYNSEGCDIGNYRIRTAFLDNEGKAVYLEFSNTEFNNKKGSEWKCFVNFAFFITEYEKEKVYLEYNLPKVTDCSKKGIVEWINKHFSTSFEAIEVLSSFDGYTAHGGKQTFNLIDDHEVNSERAEAREQAYDEVDYSFRSMMGSKYSKISCYGMDDDSITIKCHASDQALKKAGIKERFKRIAVSY